MTTTPPSPGCPCGEELTALAHGEGPPERRAELLRHLLSCPACRAEHEASQEVLLRLADLGAARATRAPARAGGARWRTAWAWVPPAAAVLLVGLALARPDTEPLAATSEPVEVALSPHLRMPPVPASPASEGTLSAEIVTRLLAGQQADGHWEGDDAPRGTTGAASATGLVLLALLRDGATALASPSVEAAVAAGTRWLEARAPALARAEGGSLDRVRSGAVVASALLRAGSLRPDARTDQALELLVPALVASAAWGGDDHATRPWLAYALGAARARGWRAAGRALDALAGSVATERPGSGRASSPAIGEPTDCTPLGLALEALREEPPVRTLAMAATCRHGPSLVR